MRTAVLGVLVASVTAALAVLLGLSVLPAQTQRPPGPTTQREVAASQLIALTADTDERTQQVVVIDPQKRTMAVYHIDKASGQSTLKSVRQIRWDLEMEEFNGVSPLPREIRSLVEQR